MDPSDSVAKVGPRRKGVMPRKRRSAAEGEAHRVGGRFARSAIGHWRSRSHDVHPNLIANWKEDGSADGAGRLLGAITNGTRLLGRPRSRSCGRRSASSSSTEILYPRPSGLERWPDELDGRRSKHRPAILPLGLGRPLVVLLRGTGESALNLRLLRGIDAQFLETPFYSSGR